MARTNISELTCDEIVVRYSDRAFRVVSAETPDIPENYAGKFASAIIVATNVELSEAQMDELQTRIEEIAGVHKAFVLIGPARIPIDRVPADTANDTYALKIKVEAGFGITKTPVDA